MHCHLIEVGAHMLSFDNCYIMLIVRKTSPFKCRSFKHGTSWDMGALCLKKKVFLVNINIYTILYV